MVTLATHNFLQQLSCLASYLLFLQAWNYGNILSKAGQANITKYIRSSDDFGIYKTTKGLWVWHVWHYGLFWAIFFYRFIVVTLETKLKMLNILAVPYTETSWSPSPSRSGRMIIKGYNLWLPCKLQQTKITIHEGRMTQSWYSFWTSRQNAQSSNHCFAYICDIRTHAKTAFPCKGFYLRANKQYMYIYA